MANTTNFGWETPDDTDLVKDGAAAMRTLGNSIDASFVDLKGGTTGQVLSKTSNTDLDFTWTNGGDITEVTAGVGISGGGTSGAVTITNSMATAIDAKGDLVVGTGADTFARLAVGANNTVLTADSATATGTKWATVPASTVNYSLISTTSLTGAATVTVSSLSGYNSLLIVIDAASSATAGSQINIGFNGNTGNCYYYGIDMTSNTASRRSQNWPNSRFYIGDMDAASAGSNVSASLFIDGTNATGFKPVHFAGSPSSSASGVLMMGIGYYSQAAVISSVSINSSVGNLDAGTVSIYGSTN